MSDARPRPAEVYRPNIPTPAARQTKPSAIRTTCTGPRPPAFVTIVR
jgi:hypothetical protein